MNGICILDAGYAVSVLMQFLSFKKKNESLTRKKQKNLSSTPVEGTAGGLPYSAYTVATREHIHETVSKIIYRFGIAFISISLHLDKRQSCAVITMQFGFFLVVIILNSMDYTGSRVLEGRRQRRISTEVTPVCPKGCEVCSEYNGCLKCLPKLFILLERNDIRQTGICLPSCPIGYFGVRTPEMTKCN
ncbi:hypothetical protein scyTo_0014955, partial [Scyliorhinus torazame]|nr:hypothetical protein [Scyliorhinus torazame]